MGANEGYAKNTELIAYHDLEGKPAFQMAMQEVEERYYIYTASYKASGWTILDVTDPSNPRYVQFLKGPDVPDQGTPKIQVADGIMVTAMSAMNGKEHVRGIYIWDVKEDPENPKFLSHWSSGAEGMGVHRFFYAGGRFEQHGELVAEDPPNGVPGPDRIPQALGDLDEQSVPRVVTQRVVYDLEVVQIQEKYSDRTAFPAGPGYGVGLPTGPGVSARGGVLWDVTSFL